MEATVSRKATAKRTAKRSGHGNAIIAKKAHGLLPFQPRPQLPKEIIKEAKRLHSLRVSITDIHRLLSDPKSYIKVPGIKNQNFNYYDFWDLLGDNKRKAAKAA